MSSKTIKKRIFIVGCPRSGTTLLQRLLSSDKRIYSFPESHFFSSLYPNKSHYIYNKLNIPSPYTYTYTYRFLDSFGYKKYFSKFLSGGFTFESAKKRFISILDQIALENEKEYWIEKTPMHLHYLNEIEELTTDNLPHIVHIVRRGDEVTASLFKVTNKYPNRWNGKRTISECVERWINDVKITKNFMHKENHHVIQYSRLVEQPDEVIKALYCNVGLDYSKREVGSADSNIVKANEPWKKRSMQSISKNRNNKFRKLFNKHEQEIILGKIKAENLSVTGI